MEGSSEIDLKSIIEKIQQIITGEEEWIEAILNRLLSFGYRIKEEDVWLITFCIQKVENYIKNSCNIYEIPKGLEKIAIERICGEFLFSKNKSGQLNEENGFNTEMAIKQVQAGDTNVVFETGEDLENLEAKLNKLISYLLSYGEGNFICYRQIKW